MDNTIIVACVTAVSGLFGSGIGAVASSRLTNYRLEQLESKVNALIKRDDDITILKEQMRGVIEDVKDLKKHGI